MAGIRKHVCVAIGGGTLVVALTCSTWAIVAAQSTEQEITKAEQIRLEARRKADAATLARLSSDDLLIVGPAGQVTDKKGASALPAVPKIAVREVKTQRFGDVAVVTGIQVGVGPNADQEQRFTRVWQRRNGQWLNVFGHVTRIAPPQALASGTTPQPVPATTWPTPPNRDDRDVLDAARRVEEAFSRKDVAAYSALTAANWVRLNRDGSATSREAYLKTVAGTPELKRSPPYNSEFQVRHYGSVALVTWLAKTQAAPTVGIRRTRVFVRDGGAWKQLVSQETDVAQS
jgi:ketosteroid isomerase-like protein